MERGGNYAHGDASSITFDGDPYADHDETLDYVGEPDIEFFPSEESHTVTHGQEEALRPHNGMYSNVPNASRPASNIACKVRKGSHRIRGIASVPMVSLVQLAFQVIYRTNIS